ncbi:MAG: glycosyltransferase [Bacteroidota bacterium]
MNKPILYLSYDGLTDPLGQSQILPYIFGLEQKGFQFIIISFEKRSRYELGEEGIRSLIGAKKIKWIPFRYHKKPPVLSTPYDLWLMRKESEKIVKNNEVELVHCRSYIPGLVGLFLKKNFGVKFLFDIRGFWADERVDGGLWNLSNPVFKWIYNYFKSKEAKMMIHSDHIISLTYAGKEEIVSGRLFGNRKVKIEEKKVTVNPCAVDLGLFDSEKIQHDKLLKLRNQLGIRQNDKIMIYLGSVGTWYLLEEMIIFFRKWLEIDQYYRFLIVTKDNHLQVKEKFIQTGLSPNKLILTESNRDEVPYHIALANVGIFFIKPAYSKKASSATKMGELLAMGLPIITNDGVGDAEILLQHERNCYCINPYSYDVELLKKMMRTIDQESNDLRNFAKEHFALEKGVSSYEKVYCNLL